MSSPDYKHLACLADLEYRYEDAAALRAAAALARKNAELRQWKQMHADDTKSLAGEVEQMQEARDLAESANRALQAEIDRLNRAVEHKDSTLRLCRQFAELKVERAALDRALAYTGTETSSEEKP